MKRVVLSSVGWNSGEVDIATSFYRRWRGLKALPDTSALLLKTKSVHGFGMTEPFLAVAIDKRLRVIETRLVRPGGMAWFPGSRLVLELSAGADPPSPGALLQMRYV